MAALKPTEHEGKVVWLGLVRDRKRALASDGVESLTLTFEGPEGEDHAGRTRRSCTRVKAQYPVGTEIANTRQICVMSAEELTAIAAAMGLGDVPLGRMAAFLGAGVVIAGIPDLTHLPPSSRLQGAEGGATMVVDMENLPCMLPAKGIEAEHPGVGARVKAAARDRRGVTAWVEREGLLRLGEAVRLHIPAQRPWAGA